MDVGQAEVPAAVAVDQLFVVQAEEVQDGGVEIVDVDSVFDGLETKIVRAPVGHSSPDAPTRHPDGKPPVVVIPPVLDHAGATGLHHRGAAELAAANDEGIFQ